ncbi:ABC transporter ATP-binding protein/permease [Candidatus Methylospira mobilis]|uniref:ABC transporter ATP-binding protein/permease n=1 Tax=Candidatus Methylospira mobilis TaxID=1808979 RepID=A0A5Q0BCP1_9GAMM|nr:SbmA/BacA-like family transporter [Candidatus Methylospira mobilis]QFY41279.1 ABC transporter ATP-binding protein/permease [Candidatus Methylospira mobilis]WNV05499.1 SbmA/BacA-like family transporter [Candidatus Methylospira mobilis]
MLHIPNLEQAGQLFVKMIRDLSCSEAGVRAKLLFIGLILFLLAFNGLNVLNSYVGRDFMTAVADREQSDYIRLALFYIGVFVASTVVGVFQRYFEELLGLLWREFMTPRLVQIYLRYPTYYRMNDRVIRKSGMGHPDQRIADDVKTFTTVTLSFVLLSLNSAFTILAFSGVLLSIDPWLFGAALAYAMIGTLCIILLGRPLIDLNYAQLDKEAAFRSGLVHVRERAESVALLHCESRLLPRSLGQFADLAGNFRKIISVNRNMGFFTSGYNYLIQIIPILLVAPLYMQGKTDFGVITQSAMAFSTLVSAFSIVVTQFQSLSSYVAVVERLINLWYVMEMTQTETVSTLDGKEDDDHVAYENLTLFSATDGHVLVKDLNISIPVGTRVIVSGTDASVKDALFKATAGVYDAGSGLVRRPFMDRILFLPERPYLPPGTLRQALVNVGSASAHTDESIEAVLRTLGIADIVVRVEGMDVQHHDWDTVLSLNEQRSVSFARILLDAPRFAVIYDPFKDCDAEIAFERLRALTEHGITYLTFGPEGREEGDKLSQYYDNALEIKAQGAWSWRTIRPHAPRQT